MVKALQSLWGRDHVSIRYCSDCGFGFSDPYVAGSADIYNLFSGGHSYYGGDKFEFTETLAALMAPRYERPRILEIGAGSGRFLAQVLDAHLTESLTATEYDDSAVESLRALPHTTVVQGDVEALLAGGAQQFDAICMFQVLEHLDRLDNLFDSLAKLCSQSGEVFIAVPNTAHTVVQERLTLFLDMPPLHVGRWTEGSLRRLANRHGFEVLETKYNRTSPVDALWTLAKYRLEARTRRVSGVSAYVESISFRPVRGGLKRLMAIWDLARLAPNYGKVPPTTSWFRLGKSQ